MSRTRSLFSTILSILSALALAAAVPSVAAAQSGRISGTVTDSSHAALAGTQVSVVGTRFTTVTDGGGRYSIGGVPAGTYDLRVQRLGQRVQIVPAVAVKAGDDTRVDVALATVPLSLGGMVVSASRRAEKITDAPATITRIDAAAIANTVGNSFAPALKEVKGIDFIQVGVTAVAINARGFNSAFNNRMLMMEDNRIAVLPENGLPVGAFTTTPKVDLAGIEVLVGPGSALYGPDASNGVLTLSTKDPREYPGSILEAAGGARSFADIQGRQAGVFAGNFGYKITGEYQQAKDFQNKNIYGPIAPPNGPPSPELNADWDTNVMRGSGALVYYMPNLSRLELTAGASKSNGIGQTSVGRNQLINWQYRDAQLKYTHPNWFAQAYMTQSLSGDTYQLNGYAQNRLRFPTLSDDSVRHLSDFPAEGRLMAAEIQNTFIVPQANGLRLTYGAQYRHDIVSSKRQWLVDRNTGEDIKTDQRGVYGQADMPLTSMFRAVFAARYDKHELFKGQFSPKAALLFTPVQDQTFRVTYNQAFKSPTVLQYGFFFPDFAPLVGVFGNPNGYQIKNAVTGGTVVRTIDPIEPERNTTWELGYKGVIADRLLVDITGYRSNFKKFMSPLVIIANPLTSAAAGGPTYAFDTKTGKQLTGSTGGLQIPLTYFNVGNAQITGTDMGLKFLVRPDIAINGTASLQKLDTVERKSTDPLEATSFNSPTTKFNVGMDFANLYNNVLRGGFTVRYVNGYHFLSGINNGKIPTFSTFDVTAGYKLPNLGASINLSVQNLLACRGGVSSVDGYLNAARPLKYTAKQECGFGKKHIEMINMPEIGTMAFLGIRFDR